MRLNILVVLAMMAFISAKAIPFKGKKINSCYAKIENDTLYLGNDFIERKYIWNDGNLIHFSIENKRSHQVFKLTNSEPDNPLNIEDVGFSRGQFSSEIIPGNDVVFKHIESTIVSRYKDYDLKRVFKIYPNSPAIESDYYIKKNTVSSQDFDPLKTYIENFKFPEKHLKVKANEFYDRTDHYNNLVKEHEIIPYFQDRKMKGNILHVQNLVTKNSLFFIKKAPCSFVQLHYPGYDFLVKNTRIQFAGLGIAPGDLKTGEWIRVYGLVTGVSGPTQLDFLTSLRAHQKMFRKRIIERDEMIMMNTWGDRNQDLAINEAFVKREVDAAVKLGITHLQVDDGWQSGLSSNTAMQEASRDTFWNRWTKEAWEPAPHKFPNGFQTVKDYADEKGVTLGLWFNPSSENEYEHWERDADIIIGLYQKYDIHYFKIDGISLPSKQAELNLVKFFDKVYAETDSAVVFNLDATAGSRAGYHYINPFYGNIFLENRYTDWKNYYPYWTLRNLWMLSKYTPAEGFQMEFLNKWRNGDKYPGYIPFAPQKLPFDYSFAITMMSQPLAWFEGSSLPEEGYKIAPLIKAYNEIQYDIHSGYIFPIGEEPSGRSWTGFQSIESDNEGFILVFRELNETNSKRIKTWLPENAEVNFKKLLGEGHDFNAKVNDDGEVEFSLADAHSFSLYKYVIR